MLKKSDSIIATSPDYLKSSVPLKSFLDKAKVVPLGLPDKPRLKSLPYEFGCLKVLSIGRLTYYKGHRILFNALAKLKRESVSLHLSVVGGGELHDELHKLRTSLGLTKEISILGKVPDGELEELIKQSHLLCLPSIERTEAFGLVLLEAMRYATPCIATRVIGSGMGWVVKDNETGLLVQPGNVDDLVLAFKKSIFERTASGRNGQ